MNLVASSNNLRSTLNQWQKCPRLLHRNNTTWLVVPWKNKIIGGKENSSANGKDTMDHGLQLQKHRRQPADHSKTDWGSRRKVW